METSAECITETYGKACVQVIDELNFQGTLWLSNAERLVSNARQERQSLQELIQKDKKALAMMTYLKQANLDEYTDDIPSQLCCPVSLNLMTDPAIAVDGNTYDWKALEEWFQSQKSKPLSPLTGAELSSMHFYPVHMLKGLCQQFAGHQIEERLKNTEQDLRLGFLD